LKEEKPEYSDVFRILDVSSTGCWYGYFYTKNESSYTLKEKFTPALEGAEVAWPINAG
jgi:hypothetical protein